MGKISLEGRYTLSVLDELLNSRYSYMKLEKSVELMKDKFGAYIVNPLLANSYVDNIETEYNDNESGKCITIKLDNLSKMVLTTPYILPLINNIKNVSIKYSSSVSYMYCTVERSLLERKGVDNIEEVNNVDISLCNSDDLLLCLSIDVYYPDNEVRRILFGLGSTIKVYIRNNKTVEFDIISC